MSDGKIMQLTAPQAPVIRAGQRTRKSLRERIGLARASRRAPGRPIPAPGQAPEDARAALAAPESARASLAAPERGRPVLAAPESVRAALAALEPRTLAASRAAVSTSAGAATPEPVLALACALEPGREGDVADAVLARARACGPGLRTVIIDLGAADSVEEASCRAVRALKENLAALGARLRLVVSSADARQQCAADGLAECLGGDAIHRSLRAALLAAYAALPGPGLVTSGVRTTLERPAEPLRCRPAARSGG